ncbi:MAG TPA: AMP-binding protein [Thermomicrobiales bacterium]|nr:AMP-binding protein [Thermomicrobiales bacterium]
MENALHQALVRWAAARPEQPFVIAAETGEVLTYGECLAAVQALRERLGPAPRHIALTLPGGIASAVVWLAALTGGHLLVPLSPTAAEPEKERAARRYAPDLLIVEQPAEAYGFGCPDAAILTRWDCERIIAQVADVAGELWPAAPGRVALTTSGTTGEPKGVILAEPQIAWAAGQIGLSHRLTPADRGLTALPFCHVNAPVVSLCASLLAGSTVVVAAHFSRGQFWSWVERYQITWASIVPTIVAALLDTAKPAFLPGALRFVRTASAPLPAMRARAFEARFGVPVVETYGLSEAASTVAANPVPPGTHKPGSVGLPVGVALRVCQPRAGAGPAALRDVSPGASGEICVRGPGLIHEYLGGAGSESFQDGWFRTGDLGRLDEDGYLFITGRLREVINRGGETIAPREIEETLLAHPAVRDVAVIGRPDRHYGEVVVACVVARAGDAVESEDFARSLHQFAAERLSPHKVPVDFVLFDALPRNPNGKLNRQRLQAQELQYAGD